MTERSSAATVELLSCPFCGGEDLTVYKHENVGSWVACVSCGLETPTETGTTPNDATRNWNTRAPAQRQPEPTFNDDESYALFLIVDTLARIERGGNQTVNYFRERLLPVYRSWHAANPHKVHPTLALPSPNSGSPHAG